MTGSEAVSSVSLEIPLVSIGAVLNIGYMRMSERNVLVYILSKVSLVQSPRVALGPLPGRPGINSKVP